MNRLNIKYSPVKVVVAFTLIMIAFTGNSQSLNIKAGLNMSKVNFFDKDNARTNYNYEYNYDSEPSNVTQYSSSKMNTLYGWNAGLTYEFQTKRRVSFETGISYMTKGYRFESNTHGTNELHVYSHEYKSMMILHYLSIPLTMKFNFLNKGMRVYGAFGADVGVALVGNQRVFHEDIDNGEIVSSPFFGVQDEQIKIHKDGLAFNVSLMAGMGIEYKNIFIEANYSAGIMNIQSMTENFYAPMVNKDIIISVGYKFMLNKGKE